MIVFLKAFGVAGWGLVICLALIILLCLTASGNATSGLWETFSEALNAGLRAALVLVVPLLFAVMILFALIWLFSKSFENELEAKTAIGHGLVFGLLGLALSFLFLLSKESFQGFLPHFVLALTLLFQLLGRLKKDSWNVPIESLPSLVGATTGLAMFLFGVLFLSSSQMFLDLQKAVLASADAVTVPPLEINPPDQNGGGAGAPSTSDNSTPLPDSQTQGQNGAGTPAGPGE